MLKKMLGVLWLVCATGTAWAGEDAENRVSDGGRAWKARCASCHAVPDFKIPDDKYWVNMLNTSG